MLYLRYDEANGIFRIGDPNYGIIEMQAGSLKEKKELFKGCFADLMEMYQTKKANFLPLKLNGSLT